MQIKHASLPGSLQKKIYPLYLLTGQDHFLLNEAAFQIKQAWQAQGETDHQILHLQTPSDWTLLIEQANSYSLFYERTLIDARYDKKTMEQAGKQALKQYLQHMNERCLVILRAPNLSAKPLQTLISEQHLAFIPIYSLNPAALKHWITERLQHHHLQFEPRVPALIQSFNEGNMLACAQAVDQLALACSHDEILTEALVKHHLIEQCDYQLYELSDACLNADLSKAVRLLRHACNNPTEATLVLWVMTQDIRQLIELSHLCKQSLTLTNACRQLKLWPQRVPLYRAALSRLSLSQLYPLLALCTRLDNQIKATQGKQVWQGFEQLAQALCGKHFELMKDGTP